MPRSQKPTTSDLFQVCRRYFSEPEARVASELLFWSQFAEHEFRGRIGFFKEDRELADKIGKHAKSIGRTLRKFGARVWEEMPHALFVLDYGPKPWARSGRVRWLFRTPRGDELVIEAQELAEAARSRQKKREQDAPIEGHQTNRPIRAKRAHRSPQTAATLIEQIDSSDLPTDVLSFAEREKKTPDSFKEKKFQEEVRRLEKLWATACNECGHAPLRWLPSEVRRWHTGLIEFCQEMRLAEITDEDLLTRLRLLAGDLDWLSDRMSVAFMRYNNDGLLIESFVRYGKKLWRAVEERVVENREAMKHQSKKALADYPDPAGTSKALHVMDRLRLIWDAPLDSGTNAVDGKSDRPVPVGNGGVTTSGSERA